MRLGFTLRQLEYFVAVGEAGSIALASERVNVSAPSISAAISQLEAEFGVKFFIRKHAHGLSLTPGGRRFFVEAKAMLDRADGLHALARDIAGTVRGPLSIGCLRTFAQLVLPEVRRSFEVQFPEVRVRQYELHQAQLIERLRKAEIDVALTYDLEIPQDLDFIALTELPPYVMVSEQHELAQSASIRPEDLAGLPMVLLDLPMSSDYFLSLLQSPGVRPVIAERTRDMSVMRSMVANGFGYGLANVRPLSDNSPDGKPLRMIPLEGSARAMRMGLLTAKSDRKPRNVMAFEAHCATLITDAGAPGLKPPG